MNILNVFITNLPYILMAILAFSVLVIWHELGHFLLAKANGIKVEEFSLGMGKKVCGFKGKETEYNLRLFPIGGFVRMLGEESESDDERAFVNKKPWQRLSVVAAGPIFNLILAVILFAISISSMGTLTPEISRVEPGSPAYTAGIRDGDKLHEADGQKINTWTDFIGFMSLNKGESINISVERSNEILDFNVKPIVDNSEAVERYIVGVAPTLEKPSFIGSIKYGFTETVSTVKQTFNFLGSMFKGNINKDQVGGPVTIFKLSSKVAKMGLINLILFMGFLSVQLGIFNIIPFPALDGGWIFMLLIEMITRKKLDENKVGYINYIGFMILLGLMVVVTLKDIFFPVQLP